MIFNLPRPCVIEKVGFLVCFFLAVPEVLAVGATAAVRVSTQPDVTDSGATQAYAELRGVINDPTKISLDAFGEADLATGEIKVKSSIEIDPFEDGLVISANSQAMFEDVLTVTRPAGGGDWEVGLPITITLGEGGFAGESLIQVSAIITVTAPGNNFIGDAYPFEFYGPDDFTTNSKSLENTFTVPSQYDSVEIEFLVDVSADAQACVPPDSDPDQCGPLTSAPVADVSETVTVKVEAPDGSTVDSVSGVFPGINSAPSTAQVPLPGWLLFGLAIGLGLIGLQPHTLRV